MGKTASEPKEADRHRLEAFRTRLQELEGALAPGATATDETARTFHDLQIALEIIAVADEEMALQNEELLHVREALEVERQRYYDLFEFAPDAYLVTDLSGAILEANRAAVEMLRVPVSLVGKPLVVFVEEKDRAGFRTGLTELGAGLRLPAREVRLTPRKAPPITALLTASYKEGTAERPANLLWILRDISAAKATAEALRDSEERLRHSQRLESVGRLAGGIAHSFNNLLAAIAFHAELVAAGLQGLPSEAAERGQKVERLGLHVEEVKRAGERAATLASQLLAFSRKQVHQPRVLDINEVVASREPMLRQLIGEDVELKIRLDSEAGAISADLTQLEQVVLNLLVNARDAMPDGGVCAIETAAVELPEGTPRLDLPPGPYVLFRVSDTGVGMDEEVRSHLFEPFFTTKDRDKGSGLGLATVYGIVRQSGGDLQVESATGVGTTFEIYLPRVAARPAPAAPPPAPRPRNRGKEVILLVEDEENIRAPAIEVLEAQGYRVLAAAEGNQAKAVAAGYRGPIHLLVTDVIMPGMNGSQLAEELTAARPDLKVLYISGYPEDSIARHGVLAPGCFFLQKPFPPILFLKKIREVLDSAPVPG